MKEMTIDQALKIIEEATAQFRGTRADHQAIVNAIQTIKAAFDFKPAEGEKK